MATMEYVRRGSVLIVVHSSAAPTATEWKRFAEDYRRDRASLTRMYVHTNGGGPSSSQRREIADAMGDVPLRAVVLTDSLVVRGIVTAMSWLKGDFMRAFSQKDSDGAMRYLDISAAERLEILNVVHSSLARLNQNKSANAA